MLTSQNIESELSYAYLHAIASHAGVICEVTGRHSDEAGIDAILRVKGKLASDSVFTQFTVDVQLKATKLPPIEQNGRFSYSIKAKNYNELRSESTAAPQLLVVLFLPETAEEWLHHSEDHLVCRKCAYWLSLKGAASIDRASKTVYIPRSNSLSAKSLRNLLTCWSRDEEIRYAE